MRALPFGTTGYENPITYTPSASSASAIRVASAASPNITGMIGWRAGHEIEAEPGHRRAKTLAVATHAPAQLRAFVAGQADSSTLNDAAAIDGASVFEKR